MQPELVMGNVQKGKTCRVTPLFTIQCLCVIDLHMKIRYIMRRDVHSKKYLYDLICHSKHRTTLITPNSSLESHKKSLQTITGALEYQYSFWYPLLSCSVFCHPL